MDFTRNIVSFLNAWRQKQGRKPLILRGARQVGKTSAVLLFGKQYFDHVIHVNFEKVEHRRLFPPDTTVTDVENITRLVFGQPLRAGKTLLFLDEIQEAPHMLSLLRFFREERPQLHVIAAGSLLKVRLKDEATVTPVGRVEYAYLYPLDFYEFLGALGEARALDFLKTAAPVRRVPEGIHQNLMRLFAEYALVGGMPEAVKTYARTRAIADVNAIYSSLFTSLLDDVYKYASTAGAKYVSFVLAQAPLFAGLPITYEKFGGSLYRSREMRLAFDLLTKAMILSPLPATKSHALPLLPQQKKPPKLIFLDVGLVNFQMGIQKEFLTVKTLDNFYHGRIAEQIVGQQILASSPSQPPRVFYWYKKTGSEAEVDFCLTREGEVVGIEVKSGTGGKLRSAHEFLRTHTKGTMIRVYGGQPEKNGGVISLPFYFLPRWHEV